MNDHSKVSRDRVLAVAARYEALGYQVLVDPPSEALPRFLGGYRPDVLARRGDDAVLVEVRPNPEPDLSDRLRDLADRVQANPGWRLDLVFENEPNQVVLNDPLPVMASEDVRRRCDEAERLLQEGHMDAALLVAWAATEGALRLLAGRNAIGFQRSETPTLLKQLASMGVIERGQYQELWSSYQQRSAVAHGFATRGRPDAAREAIDLGKALLAEAQRAA